ncbi:MAG: purine-nucleoside phosphorylase [Oligoflexia bacterium]|nr:purine-nucleoside phosphorylase [Oligoflexia bacterium]MBF0365731.1 purine-nucleoside phosphorylase [Oligoflexia bacterium]
MSIHIAAKAGEIAEVVLMPGDPMRAQYIANKYLQNATCYNQVRGMFGFTGTYKGKRISIQGSGMGIPSFSIYATELITSYGVKKIMRIGSCGALLKQVNIRDVILAMSASTDSGINDRYFQGMTFAPTASFELLNQAYKKSQELKIDVKVGNIFSTDLFYDHIPDSWKIWASFGVLAVEMEAAALYTLAAKHGIQALAILTVSDHLVTQEACSSEEREKTFNQMLELALETA